MHDGDDVKLVSQDVKQLLNPTLVVNKTANNNSHENLMQGGIVKMSDNQIDDWNIADPKNNSIQ